ncbi:unnamed protein product [Polarella glacialis]|uniref:Uncharacterized protein n=1 Tax=Polarella glacialis TaxID=89957 RepID=A0A813KJE5_POLGL|nr:unnamed protein product [Polarella glacialis]
MGVGKSTHTTLSEVTDRAEGRMGRLSVEGRYHRFPMRLEDSSFGCEQISACPFPSFFVFFFSSFNAREILARSCCAPCQDRAPPITESAAVVVVAVVVGVSS